MNLNNQEILKLDLNNFHLLNDPLLQKVGIFYEKNKLNIYKILIRLDDFKINTKGQFYKKIPFIVDSDNNIQSLLNKLPKKYRENNYLNLRKLVCKYQSSIYLRWDTFQSFTRNKYYPITFLRVLCRLIDERKFHIIAEKNYITDFSRSNKIRLFTDINRIPDFLFYLFGVILGDGTINKERIKIVDGDEREDKLKFSKVFLEGIRRKIMEIFDTRVPQVQKIKNKKCYELIFHNKWLCYFLNSLFGLEFGEKIDPKTQRNFTLTDYQKSLIIRGLFDTDGSLDKCRVTFATKYKHLLNEVLSFLRDQGINNISIRKISNDRIKPVYLLGVHGKEIVKYAELIGFSHPRKSLEIKKYILSDSRDRVVKSVQERDMNNIGNFIRPIANVKLRVMSNFFKLNPKKKKELINLFNDKFDCDFEKLIRKNNCINNKKLTRLFTRIFEFEPGRKALTFQTVSGLYQRWLEIWN